MIWTNSYLQIKVLIDKTGYALENKLKEKDILTAEEFELLMREGYRIVSLITIEEEGLKIALINLER